MNFPQIEDHQKSLAELDIAFTYSLCRNVDELYNVYTAMHDLVTKDIEKLLRPRDETESTNGKEKPVGSTGK